VYSVTALVFGPDSRLCGLILEWEQEDLDYRRKRRRKALEAVARAHTDLGANATPITIIVNKPGGE
jgi:hypothetical protein